jgi:murein DD-endopeptidase MepM/ murein hydrolase activator NlpD
MSFSGGIFVRVQNAQHFDLIYGHLSKVYVEKGQLLKRGQLIGLSGASNDGVPHLHFGISKVGGSYQQYSQTYDPDKFWLDGRPKCFDPSADYSKYFQKGITIPIACGAYAKQLITVLKE